MRIHLSLDPKYLVQGAAGPSSGPLVNIGGDLVLIELQGELNHEGDKDGGVVGILGLDRPDKPTLHLGQHHLLHGKMANLPKPYAVIRRALALAPEGTAGEVEGDAEDEDDLEDDLLAIDARPIAAKGKGKQKAEVEEEEEELPLFPDILQTPPKKSNDPSSSPSSVYPSSAIKDYSSELDFSSPPMSDTSTSKGDRNSDLKEDSDEDDYEAEEERRRKKAKKSGRKERTRRYEVVGIVRKKVVFALRPEPIVTATILPE